MKIIGAGMSGMLAGQYFRHMSPVIYEKQPSLPNNHKALLRFRSDSVSQLTGIPFKKVKVTKMINYKEEHILTSNIHLNNLYSQKVTGMILERSLGNLEQCERYIAPEDFINQLSNGLYIKYDCDSAAMVAEHCASGSKSVIISTMPVLTLAGMLNYELKTELQTRKIWSVRFKLPEEISCNVYQTVYYPNPKLPLYRMSITGDNVIAEFCENPTEKWNDKVVENLFHFLEIDFGIILNWTNVQTELNEQKYGKLLPCRTNEVRDFLSYATHEHNIYSLGRWGTHRQILMDDVVNDLKVIQKMITTNRYER